jgi:hypothetical protein
MLLLRQEGSPYIRAYTVYVYVCVCIYDVINSLRSQFWVSVEGRWLIVNVT